MNNIPDKDKNGFYLEKRLRDGNPELHRRMNDSILVFNNMLKKYAVRFPGYTDHSMFHSLDIIEYCNDIIGIDQVAKLSPDECYVLMMASYMHDIGMGINNEDYISFSKIPRSSLFSGEKQISYQFFLIWYKAAVFDHFFDFLLTRPPCIGDFLCLEMQIFE